MARESSRNFDIIVNAPIWLDQANNGGATHPAEGCATIIANRQQLTEM
jgi:hypothetical protein